MSLEAIFLFKGYHNSNLFPSKIKKIIDYEWDYDGDKGIYLAKLPAPSSGAFGPVNGRLGYISSLSIEDAIDEFEHRIKMPLNLEDLTPFEIRHKFNGDNKGYWQANSHHKKPEGHTYLSIRSRKRK